MVSAVPPIQNVGAAIRRPHASPQRGHEPARRQWRSQGQAQCVQRSAGDDGALSPRISAASPQTEVVERSETGGVSSWATLHPQSAAHGKRISHNVYAKTREECEEKLAAMIEKVKREIVCKKLRK